MSPAPRLASAASVASIAGLAATACVLAARSLHYSGLPLFSGLDAAIGRSLELYFSLVLVQLTLFLPASAALIALLALLFALRRGALMRRTSEGWETRAWVSALLWLQILLANFLLDLDPGLALAFGAGVVWHLVLSSRAGAGLAPGPGRPWLAWAGFFLVIAPWQMTWTDRLALGMWCAFQPSLTRVVKRASSWRDRLWPALVAVMAGQLLAAMTPHFFSDPALPIVVAVFVALRFGVYRLAGRPRRGAVRFGLALLGALFSLAVGWEIAERVRATEVGAGSTRLAADLAYNYCESPERGLLAVTMPICAGPGGPECLEGRIDLYRLDSLELERSLRPFDEEFSGRLEQIVCEDERLLVGMCCASPGEHRDRLTVMSVAWSGEVLEEALAPEHETNRVLPDPEANGLWLAGRDLVFRDRATGATKLLASRRPPGIFVVERESASERRKSVFVGEFINASAIREIDRETLQTRRTLETANGSVVAVTVDDERRRLYVTGLWGLDVLDIDSGERLAARRLGFATRTPLVDERRGLVYLPSTTNGKVYVLDRDDLSLLGALSVGLGPRNVFLAGEGRWFLASSEHGLWYWDADELAARFKPGAGLP